MKKLIILLAVLPLVLSSCLKDDKDAFGKTASERIREVQEGTEKALTGAANGWSTIPVRRRSTEALRST